VRADLLDAVDDVLRRYRDQAKPFGGVQLLMIGDLYQLPPVVKQEDWELLRHHYQTPYFFGSLALQNTDLVVLELKQIFRQTDGRFIELLNNIRNNQANWEDMEWLHDHYDPEFIASKGDHYITLTSHNAKADSINQEELSKLRGPSHAFEAVLTGEFNDKAYPAEKTLSLKEGAQVMLIKNDKGEVRRYYNGKIGTIKKIAEGKIARPVIEQAMAAVLRFQRQGKIGIAADIDFLDRVHLDRDGQRHENLFFSDRLSGRPPLQSQRRWT